MANVTCTFNRHNAVKAAAALRTMERVYVEQGLTHAVDSCKAVREEIEHRLSHVATTNPTNK